MIDGLSLDNNITLYEPKLTHQDEPQPTTQPPSPSLIIICTWLGASTKAITKYLTGYHTLHPSAPILLLRTELADMAYRTQRTIHARLAPARDALTRHAGPNTLLHFFSYGGCSTAVHLLASLAPPARARLHRQLRLVVSDCCPGDASFTETYRAGLASLPPATPLRALCGAALWSAVAVVYALHGARVIDSVPGLRAALLDPRVLGHGARRLYLASDGDVVIAAGEVVGHVRLARAAGYRAGFVRFGTAPHCALVSEDPGKYWGAIRDNWVEERVREDAPLLAKL